MSRTKGTKNKEIKLPEAIMMPEEQRVELVSNLILQIITEEETKA